MERASEAGESVPSLLRLQEGSARTLARRVLYGGGRAGRGRAGSGGGRRVRWAPGSAAGGGRGADGGRGLALLLCLQSLATYVVMLFPVLVLAEGTAVTRRVAAAAGLARLAPTIPAALHGKRGKVEGRFKLSAGRYDQKCLFIKCIVYDGNIVENNPH